MALDRAARWLARLLTVRCALLLCCAAAAQPRVAAPGGAPDAGSEAGAVAAPATAPASQPQAPTAKNPATHSATGPSFVITFDPTVSPTAYTGRVYVALTRRRHLDPLDLVNWFDSEPLFAHDARDWRPIAALRLSAANTLGYPVPLDEIKAGTYRVQAAMDLNGWDPHPVNSPGNGYSDAAVFRFEPGASPEVHLEIRHLFPVPDDRDTDERKFARVHSRLLSDFHKRDVFVQGAVHLPEVYTDDADRRFPTVYMIPGFSGSMRSGMGGAFGAMYAAAGLDAVVVELEPGCPTGHHVFADSANNGPWGTALVTEFIPYLEREFRVIADPAARYLTGHSSGGWSSLWLQITYPEAFGGVWSTSPDPVDFRAFMLVDIYAPEANAFFDPAGEPLTLSRPGPFGRIASRELSDLECVLGRGGQLGSFEAVFSPRGPDGKPVRLWDRKSGEIDPQVAEQWRKYDIRHILQSNWPTLGPRLGGKINIICGEQDDFYLERAVVLLREALREVGSDGKVDLVPSAGHTLPPMVFTRIGQQMAAHFSAYKNLQNGVRR